MKRSINSLVLFALLFLCAAIATCITARAQSSIAVGVTASHGAYGYYEGARLDSANSVGVFTDARAEFVSGKAVIAPKALITFEHSDGKNGGEIRPELEGRAVISEYFQPFAAAGVTYQYGENGISRTNPLISAGAQLGDLRLSVGRILPSAEDRYRGWLYRADYTRLGLFSEYFGLLLSAEYLDARSQLATPLSITQYSGYKATARVGLVIGKKHHEDIKPPAPQPQPNPVPVPAIRRGRYPKEKSR